MNLKDLSVPAMLAVSGAWTDPEHKRALLEHSPVGRALLPEIEAAHGALLRADADADRQDTLFELQEEQAAVDLVHDRKLRGAYYVLTGLAEVTDDDGEKAALLAARDQLSPLGLAEAQRTYRDEAREIEFVEGRLTAETRLLLQRIPAPGGVLWASVEARFAAARRLAALEARRAELTGSDAAASVLHARNAWVQVVRALDASLAIDAAGQEARRELLGDIERARGAVR
jgi:hypothetical protein